eukprot:905095-Amphidinium_carterae.1
MSRMRKLTLQEYFRSQGIPVGRLKIPSKVSERQVRGMVGNAFPVPLVAKIVDRLLYSAGVTSEPSAFEQGTGEDGEVWS